MTLTPRLQASTCSAEARLNLTVGVGQRPTKVICPYKPTRAGVHVHPIRRPTHEPTDEAADQAAEFAVDNVNEYTDVI